MGNAVSHKRKWFLICCTKSQWRINHCLSWGLLRPSLAYWTQVRMRRNLSLRRSLEICLGISAQSHFSPSQAGPKQHSLLLRRKREKKNGGILCACVWWQQSFKQLNKEVVLAWTEPQEIPRTEGTLSCSRHSCFFSSASQGESPSAQWFDLWPCGSQGPI